MTWWPWEAVSAAITVLAVAGVLLNNRRRRGCFVVWMFSNSASLVVHLAAGLYVLALRDALFFVLAVEGWRKWGGDACSG